MSESTHTIVRPQSAEVGGVHVRVVAGPSAGATASGRKVTVGRSRLADLPVNDFTVSEFHVELRGHERGIEIIDLSSWNGTFHGEVGIGRGFVPNGATINIGQSAVVVSSIPIVEPQRQGGPRESYGLLLGRSKIMQDLFGLLERLAATDLAVFVEGPTGTGKELVAKALHDTSPRARGPFVVLDCASLPATLAESVLFGHAAGAFTGAQTARPGVFEAADGGTVFLDEVGELPLDLQPKLLRVLESRAVTRVGENNPRPVSIRLLSATWRDLRGMINQGRFRDDLFYRLAQARVELPALKDRREDIEFLIAHFLKQLPKNIPCARSISREALAELTKRDYPGNIRELRNAIERAAYMSDGSTIRASDLAFERMLDRERDPVSAQVVQVDQMYPPTQHGGGSQPPQSGDLDEFKSAKRTAVDDFERDYLARLMAKMKGNIAHASVAAGIERHHLRTLLRKHGLYVPT